MKSQLKILLIAYFFPPMGGVGVQRVAKWAQYLPSNNCELHILTTDHPSAPHDPTLLAMLPKQIKIHRSRDIVFTRSATSHSQSTANTQPKHGLHLGSVLNSAAQFFLRPNQHVLWKPLALHAAQKLFTKEHFDVVITTSPPLVNHLIGLELQQLTGVPLIADFRDLPEWHPFYAQGTPLHRAHDRHIVRNVLSAADGVIAVSPGMRDHLRRMSQGRRDIAVIPNGFDRTDFPKQVSKKNEKFLIGCVGSFDMGHPVEPLLDLIAKMQNKHANLHKEVQFSFLGNANRSALKKLQNPLFKKILNYHPFESHAKALQFMQQSDALLLHVPQKISSEGHIPAKTFEYLAAQRPILALAPLSNDAATIIRRTGTGVVGDSGDIAEAASKFLDVVTQLRDGKPVVQRREEIIAQYDRKKQTESLVQYIKTVIRT